MKAKDIQKVIEEFIKKSGVQTYKSIFIDGDWGCGKTYNINETLKKCKKEYNNAKSSGEQENEKDVIENKKCIKCRDKDSKVVNVYYISLFGVDSVDDLYIKFNNTIRSEALKKTAKALDYVKVFIRDLPDLGLTNGVVDELDYILGNQLGKTKKVKESGDAVVIFDDIERIGSNLSYISLLGFLYSLMFIGYRIVCVGSSKNINKYEDIKVQTQFDDFKEKAFERIYYVDEYDVDVLYETFKDVISKDETKYFLYDNFKNIRIIQKAKNLYDDLIRHIANAKTDDYLNNCISQYDLIRCCIYATSIIYEVSLSNDDIDRINKNNLERDYGFRLSKFPNDIKYKLLKVYDNLGSSYRDENFTILDFMNALTSYLYSSSFASVDKLIKPTSYNTRTNTASLRLLAYKENIELSNRFLEVVENGKYPITNRNAFSQIRSFLAYTYLDVNEEIKEKLATAIASSNKNYFDFRNKFSHFFETMNENGLFNEVFRKAVGKIKEGTSAYLSEAFCALRDKDDYDNLVETIEYYIGLSGEDVSLKEALPIIGEVLKENDYFLPDLSKTFTASEWRYYYRITNYASNCLVLKDFKKYLSKYDNTEDLSIKHRCKQLNDYIDGQERNIDHKNRISFT